MIPEDKIIYNDKKQEEDFLNELVKTIDEKDFNTIKYLKKQLNNFSYLKKTTSDFDKDNNIISAKIPDDNYKPLIDTLLNFEDNLIYKPIVSEKKNFIN